MDTRKHPSFITGDMDSNTRLKGPVKRDTIPTGDKTQQNSRKRQSPVNLMSLHAVYDSILAANQLVFNYSTSRDTDIFNNGSSLVIFPRSKQVLTSPLLSNGEEYELGEIHFHWGRENTCGSEHTVNNKAFPMEVQLIHWNCRYHANIKAATGKQGGVVIASLFTQIGREHQGLRVITDNLEDVLYKGRQKSISSAFNPACLLPDPSLRDYWMYDGSHTTAPYSEEVTWILFRWRNSDVYIAWARVTRSKQEMMACL